VTSNTGFLARLVGCAAFRSADLDTGLIERNHGELFPPAQAAGEAVLALAAFAELAGQRAGAQARAAASADPLSPWAATDGWRLNQDNQHTLRFRDAGAQYPVIVHFRPKGWELELNGVRRRLRGECGDNGQVAIRLDEVSYSATVVRRGALFDVFHAGTQHSLELHDPLAHAATAEETPGSLTAPMPGRVIAVLVKTGALVARGAPLLILEAMKMEHTICAPADGRITAIYFGAGDQVTEGSALLSLEDATS
jgi:3-methylcrotonyl-CoA carboxylase alpha subunit